MQAIDFECGTIATRDDVRLHYIEAGSGTPLVFIPGWSQTAAMFRFQLEGLRERFRVIAIDMRGHGKSDKPAHGYRIARLAADLHDALDALELSGVILAGHSMGCSVIWSYLEQFGESRISKLILIDQAPVITARRAWTEQEKADYGSIFTAQDLFDAVEKFEGPGALLETRKFIEKRFFTPAFPQQMIDWVTAENLQMPRPLAARLLLDHGAQDWRDAITRIRLPSLVVGAEKSLFTVASQKWIAASIRGAELQIFNESEGGSHFMWLENPSRFNELAQAFACRPPP
jgi:pimeloyl-ACP methyl ester carboxylesterase